MRQHLVLCREGGLETLDRDHEGVRVLHTLPPRLALVEADEAALEPLRRNASIVLDEAIDTEGPQLGLSEAERLMIDSWRSAKESPAGRLGEGLAWDTEGFSAP